MCVYVCVCVCMYIYIYTYIYIYIYMYTHTHERAHIPCTYVRARDVHVCVAAELLFIVLPGTRCKIWVNAKSAAEIQMPPL